MTYLLDVLFAALFVALTTVVIVLILKLRANNLALLQDNTKDSNYFKMEINTLSFILFFFSLSYLLRVIFDSSFGFEMSGRSFTFYAMELMSSIPYDLVPLALVLFLHRRNLRQREEKIDGWASEQRMGSADEIID